MIHRRYPAGSLTVFHRASIHENERIRRGCRTPRRAGGCEVGSDHPGVAVRRVRRGPDAWVLAVSGELSQRSAGLVSGAVSTALANSGRVLVDVSGLRVTWPPAVGLFGSILAGMGGWPGVRLVLFGADAELARSLAAQRVSATVPVAPDETTARQLLDRRPRVLARHLDLEQPRSATRRARTFVRAACADWQLDDSATTPRRRHDRGVRAGRQRRPARRPRLSVNPAVRRVRPDHCGARPPPRPVAPGAAGWPGAAPAPVRTVPGGRPQPGMGGHSRPGREDRVGAAAGGGSPRPMPAPFGRRSATLSGRSSRTGGTPRLRPPPSGRSPPG